MMMMMMMMMMMIVDDDDDDSDTFELSSSLSLTRQTGLGQQVR